ncbi:hypothetical protein [Nocardia sp. NPDC024068]|uniref:hypothetical protein n=1 Tax=Nocardia sp. NPDC024068 TaxID=3157197 RepID=UPI0033E132FE
MQPAADPAGAVGAGVDPENRAQDATVPIRPLSFRELLDLPFALLQADIRLLAGCAGILLVSGELVVAGFIGLISHLTDGSDEGTALAAIFATLGAAWLLRVALRGVTVTTGLARVLGAPVDLRESVRRTGARLGPLLLTQAVFTAIGIAVLAPSAVLFPLTFVGGLLWFLLTYPLLILLLAWLRAIHSVAEPVLFAERTTAGAALKRSAMLSRPLRARRAGLRICLHLLFAVLIVPLLGLMLFAGDISGTHRWPFLILVTTGALLLVAFAEVVEAAARVVGYLDLRCRREGFDIRIPAGGPR